MWKIKREEKAKNNDKTLHSDGSAACFEKQCQKIVSHIYCHAIAPNELKETFI